MTKRKMKKSTLKSLVVLLMIILILAVAVSCYITIELQSSSGGFGDDEEVEVPPASGLQDVFGGVTTSETGILKVTFVDVGQGDCIFVEFPDGKNMLIDNGKYTDKGVQRYPGIKKVIDESGATEISLVIGTHAHADHIGNMPAVFRDYDVKYCLRPFVYYSGSDKNAFDNFFNQPSLADSKQDCSTKTYFRFLDSIKKEGCGCDYFTKDSDFTQKFTYKGAESSYTVDFLTPTAEIPYIGYKDANDYSPIMTLEYNGYVFMFTGDAEAVAEEEFLNYYGKDGRKYPNVDVLKVGHHGSNSSSTKNFLNAISPEIAVIQCGWANEYHHPTAGTLQNLTDAGALIYRNDLQGTITFEVDMMGFVSNITTEEQATADQLLKPGL